MKSRVLCIVIVSGLLQTVSSSFCYWNSGCPYKYFSDKTPYNNVRGDIRDSVVKLKGCEPISIWAFLSAGKNIPNNFPTSLSEALAIRNNVISSYEHGKSSLCAQDIENLQTWNTDNKTLSKANFLTEEGSQELIGIANRLQQAFPQILQNLKGNYKIAAAPGGVTEESAKDFVKSFSNIRLNIEKENEDIVAPYKSCKAYQDLLENPDLYTEVEKYKKTADFLATKDRIQRRLGISQMSEKSVKSLYNLCRYSWSGIENKFSPWCALFTTEDLRVLEYIGDLENYYKNGYGNSFSESLGKIALADLLIKFQEVREGHGKNFVAYFSDTTTLNMLVTGLGLFKDESPLSAKRSAKRKWRSSKLSVFSANLVAVLNRCGQIANPDYNIVFYWNEEPLRPICERGFCSWDEFSNKLLPFVNITKEFCNK